MPDSATLTVDVRARRIERLLGVLALLAIALASSLLSIYSPLHAAAFFMFTTAIVLFGLWQQGWLGSARRIATIAWLPDGRWLLTDDSQTGISADLRADSRIGSRWLWLRWDAHHSRRSMLLFQGDIPAVDLRRLVVRLRLQSRSACP